MASFQAVVFDFDYTLADSSAGVIECVTRALDQLGFSIPSRDRIHQTIGLSLAATFQKLTGDFDAKNATEFSLRFHEHADQVMEVNTVLYPSVPAVMRRIRDHGLRTGIVSTKYRRRVANI